MPPHLVLRELAQHGRTPAGRGPDARLAHGTRVLAHALATARPGRPASQTVDLAAQALAALIQAPLVAVRALLLVRNLARELARDRGR